MKIGSCRRCARPVDAAKWHRYRSRRCSTCRRCARTPRAGGRDGGSTAVSTIATSGGSAMWYLTRGSGIASVVFLTVSVLLGILTSLRWSSESWPRFVIEFIHRNVSLLVVVFLVIHVVTVLVDPFAPIRLVDVFIPFVSAYRPIWLELGALALDLPLEDRLDVVEQRRKLFRAGELLQIDRQGLGRVVPAHLREPVLVVGKADLMRSARSFGVSSSTRRAGSSGRYRRCRRWRPPSFDHEPPRIRWCDSRGSSERCSRRSASALRV